MSSHDVYDELAVGYALAALEPADEQTFLRHLPSCATCERALAEHLETLSHLAYAAPDAAPPPSLWEGIRAGIASSGRGESTQGEFGPVLSLQDARTDRSSRAALVKKSGLLTAVAAGLVMIAVLVGNVSFSPDPQSSAASRAVAEVIRSMGADGPVEQVGLHGPGKQVEAVALMRGDDIQIVVVGLEPNDTSTSIYVLWERSRLGDVRAIGTFDVPSKEPKVVKGIQLNHATSALASLVVTREKGRKAPAGTTQPAVLAGELPADRA